VVAVLITDSHASDRDRIVTVARAVVSCCVSVRATSLLSAGRILIGYFPAPQALASTAMHQVVLAFGSFSEFDRFANVSFRTTGSNVYGFSAEYCRRLRFLERLLSQVLALTALEPVLSDFTISHLNRT
jgi:hypothetical protein